jgi:hypothetical protein
MPVRVVITAIKQEMMDVSLNLNALALLRLQTRQESES